MNPAHPTHMAKQTHKPTTEIKSNPDCPATSSQARPGKRAGGRKVCATAQTEPGKDAGPGVPAPASAPLPDVIHLGVDVHLKQYVICRKIDGATPQPAQRMKPELFEAWAVKQQALARRVVCCYEAGPFGYVLQRRLAALGISCHVVRPQNWDKHGQRVKTDGRDARELAEALARYEAGNRHAMAVVRVPEAQQEARRMVTRQRTSFVNEVRRLGAMGRSHGMTQGCEISGRWWRRHAWEPLSGKLPALLKALLEPLREVLGKLEELISKLTGQIEQQAVAGIKRPKGLGALTEQIIGNEVVDWTRFNNRRQVGSYTGLCPSEHSSGGSRRLGSINKHGNPRLRHALVEAVWRLIRLQPGWKRAQKFLAKLTGGEGQKKFNKKKMAVALARELAVDLWRLNTGRCTLAELGFEAAAPGA
jgi:transposase